MKIRNGFVSNSSSSSFIIDMKEPKTCECCGRKGISLDFIRDLCEKNYSPESEIMAEGKDAVLNYIKNNWCVDDGSLDEEIEQIKIAENPVLIEIDYNAGYLFNALLDKDIKVIYRD